jgi:heat shock protein HtpX
METSRSLQNRALMALFLMVGFYGFALAISLGLLWVPYAEFVYLDRIHLKIALFCIGGAGVILWALVPRVDKFEAPGPRLTPGNAPQLFTIIEEVAKATNQARPEEVYLLNDVNAWVTHRGGVMGFGSRRVMGVGLPLLKGLSPSELKSVVAHEFGHYVSGDVALGPWIYKTRAAIGRTIHGVTGWWLLEALFNWYARLFMRMTTLVSREQEFVADATAARVAGADAAVSALKRVEVLAPAYSIYLENEVMPVLRAGFLPPVSDGFERYLNDPDTAKAFESLATEIRLGAEAGEFDTHPPTAERIAAIEKLKTSGKAGAKASSAVATDDSEKVALKEPDRHARALLEHDFGRDNVLKLRHVSWDDVGVKVYGQMWQAMAQQYAKWLGSLTADQIPADPKWFEKKGEELAKDEPDADQRVNIAAHVLACAIGEVMVKGGWAIQTAPGRPILLVRAESRFEPHDAVFQLAKGALTADAWKIQCVALGISGVRLANHGEEH